MSVQIVDPSAADATRRRDALVADQNFRNEQLRRRLGQEIRKIEGSKMTKLSEMIDNSKDLDQLLEALTMPPPEISPIFARGKPPSQLNLSMDTINLIKNQIHCGKSPTMALLNHWSITGRRRPTVETLLEYLRFCNLRRAHNYVIQEVLELKPEPLRLAIMQQSNPPSSSAMSIEDTFYFDELQGIVEKLSPTCKQYSFDLIYHSTNKFCHRPHDFRTKSGAKIGEGRFSSVYRAHTRLVEADSSGPPGEANVFAAKLLKSDCNKDLLVNEINLISKVDHENVLKFLGISLGKLPRTGQPAYICLIYPYMENGSLLDCLANGLPARDFTFLQWSERLRISKKVAEAISYLHEFREGPIIHRDIKSANILLDASVEPKLGDFTIVRQIDTNSMYETLYSQVVIGTSVYMPPEAFRGVISTKFDSFSFGVVLLELLTGMRPFIEEEEDDLLTFVTEKLSSLEIEQPDTFEQAKESFLADIIDRKAGDFNLNECKLIFKLALQATESRKNSRPTIREILDSLKQMRTCYSPT